MKRMKMDPAAESKVGMAVSECTGDNVHNSLHQPSHPASLEQPTATQSSNKSVTFNRRVKRLSYSHSTEAAIALSDTILHGDTAAPPAKPTPAERLRRIRAKDAEASKPFIASHSRERAQQPSSYEVQEQQLRVARSASHNEAARHVTGAPAKHDTTLPHTHTVSQATADGVTTSTDATDASGLLPKSHMSWTRDKSIPIQMTPPVEETSPAEDEFALTPSMALQWQHLTFAQFKASVNYKRLSGFDRQAWSEYNKVTERIWNISELERKVLAGNSPFAQHLLALKEELADPVLPSVFNLPNVLRDLCEDDHPQAAKVWVRLSRGSDLLPPQIREDMHPTEVHNYPVNDPLLRRQMPTELQRHFDLGYCKTWSQIQKEFGVTESKPKNILPINAIPKNLEVCRITFDPSNTMDDNVLSVNEYADTLPKPTCIYPNFTHATAAMYRYGYGIRADDQDAFLMHPLKPRSMSNCGFVDPRTGEMCALVKLGLGFQASAAIQQDTEVAQVRAWRRRLRKLGLHTSGPDPDYGRKFPHVKPDTNSDSMTAALPYCDDIGAWFTTLVAAWFACMHLLLQKHEWGVKLGMKEGKTDPPAASFEWIGYWFMMRLMQFGFRQKKLDKMVAAVTPFSSVATTTPNVKQARSAYGLLNHATNVIRLGKAYAYVVQKRVVALDTQSKRRTAPDNTPVVLDAAGQHAMDMWLGMLSNLNVRSAMIGVRRQKFPYPGYSDAAFSTKAGWCFHCMGMIWWGKWPPSWLNRLGPHSEYAEIFITECELWAILGLCRRMFPKCRGMVFEGFADNLSTVYMLNKLSTSSERCRLIVTEILWLAVVWDVEISYRHIPTDINVLSDFGTRQEDKDFGARDAKLLELYKVSTSDTKYSELSTYRKKLVQFCMAEHTEDIPLLPIFPMRLATLIRFAWWCQYHNVEGGMKSIRNYVSAATEWCQAMGCADPRQAEPWIYDRFKREAPKCLEVFNGSRAKFAITHSMFLALYMHLDLSNLDHLQDAATYSVLFFTAVRRGHIIPKSKSAGSCKHLLRWEHVMFLPNFESCTEVVYLLESGKVRTFGYELPLCIAKKDPTFTATGRCNIAKICPVQLMRLWYLRTFTGNSRQFVFARTLGGYPPMERAWTQRMRTRLTSAALAFGMREDEFSASHWSGISFRKGSLTALASHLQPHQLAAHGDHSSVETSYKYYLELTIEARAHNTKLLEKGFLHDYNSPANAAPMIFGTMARHGTQ